MWCWRHILDDEVRLGTDDLTCQFGCISHLHHITTCQVTAHQCSDRWVGIDNEYAWSFVPPGRWERPGLFWIDGWRSDQWHRQAEKECRAAAHLTFHPYTP